MRSSPAYRPQEETAGGSGPCFHPIGVLRVMGEPGGSPGHPAVATKRAPASCFPATAATGPSLRHNKVGSNYAPATLAEKMKTQQQWQKGCRCVEEHNVRKQTLGELIIHGQAKEALISHDSGTHEPDLKRIML